MLADVDVGQVGRRSLDDRGRVVEAQVAEDVERGVDGDAVRERDVARPRRVLGEHVVPGVRVQLLRERGLDLDRRRRLAADDLRAAARIGDVADAVHRPLVAVEDAPPLHLAALVLRDVVRVGRIRVARLGARQHGRVERVVRGLREDRGAVGEARLGERVRDLVGLRPRRVARVRGRELDRRRQGDGRDEQRQQREDEAEAALVAQARPAHERVLFRSTMSSWRL